MRSAGSGTASASSSRISSLYQGKAVNDAANSTNGIRTRPG
jgi:hypothetical protein